MHHPWRAFGRLVEWTVHFVELPAGVLGLTLYETKAVLMATGMTQVERRCTIEHERQHILRGPAAPGLESREELRVRKDAARILLPDVHCVADALVWAGGDVVEAADELWVDVATLEDRLRFMTHPAERTYLRRRLRDVGLVAAPDGEHIT